ncbi:uncharacterized protein LOC120850362 [Ixodes scapularis]|uniref:uncharacterized protein LOC120850362 n=1 Tax=Ixodes scapularis TaxID=6945 RepID=UPI001A9FBEAE|nr:uncharacterized protein LOC120850362 [Ixodes scapularis]
MPGEGTSDASRSATSNQGPTTILCAGALRQRDPKLFSGIGDDDIDDWLESVERVSLHNKWDDVLKLNNVIFYLTDVAKLWYTNHESELATWTLFKSKIQEVFGKPAQRKLISSLFMRIRSHVFWGSRVQQNDESFVSYIEDVLKLCKRIDTQMPEDEKLKNIMKGIAEDAFQILVVRAPATVIEAIDICQNFLELRTQRLPLSRKPQPPMELASLNNAADCPPDKWGDLRYLIQEIVRDEVARQLGKPATSPESYVSPSIRALIQDNHFLPLVGKDVEPTYGGPRRIDQFAFHVVWLDMSLGFVDVGTLKVMVPHHKLTIDQASLVVVEVMLSKITPTTNGSNDQADLRLPDDARCLLSAHVRHLPLQRETARSSSRGENCESFYILKSSPYCTKYD